MNTENNNRLPEVVVTCVNEPLPFAVISILYESAILAAATILGVLSFKAPANFSEAKYVYQSPMYCSTHTPTTGGEMNMNN